MLNDSPKGIRPVYSQLSISRVQFCSSRGYLLRSIIHAAVVVILKKKTQMGEERKQERKYCIIDAVVNVIYTDGIDRKIDSKGVRKKEITKFFVAHLNCSKTVMQMSNLTGIIIRLKH